jgi:hypothetical protein
MKAITLATWSEQGYELLAEGAGAGAKPVDWTPVVLLTARDAEHAELDARAHPSDAVRRKPPSALGPSC